MSTETTSEGFSIRPKGCPSELELDQLHLGELSDADAVRVQAAVEDSEFARESLAKRETGFVSFPEVNAEKMVAEIYRQTSAVDFSLDVDDGSLLERFFKKWFGSGILVAAAVAFTVVFSQPSLEDELGQATIGIKGGPSELVVHRKIASGIQRAEGTVFQAGDIIRFQVDIPSSGHGMLVARNSRGMTSLLFPGGKTSSVAMNATPGEILPGELALVEPSESDWVFWVYCNDPFQLRDLRFGDVPGILIPAGDCSITSVQLKIE